MIFFFFFFFFYRINLRFSNLIVPCPCPVTFSGFVSDACFHMHGCIVCFLYCFFFLSSLSKKKKKNWSLFYSLLPCPLFLFFLISQNSERTQGKGKKARKKRIGKKRVFFFFFSSLFRKIKITGAKQRKGSFSVCPI